MVIFTTYVLPSPFYEHALHIIIQSHGCLLTSRLGLVSPVAIMIIMTSMDLPFSSRSIVLSASLLESLFTRNVLDTVQYSH